MLSPDAIAAVTVPGVFGILAIVAGVRMLFRHRERMAELTSKNARGVPGPEIDARLARLEQAVDAIAVEIERTGEAQRYLTKVLTSGLPAESRAADAQSRLGKP